MLKENPSINSQDFPIELYRGSSRSQELTFMYMKPLRYVVLKSVNIAVVIRLLTLEDVWQMIL